MLNLEPPLVRSSSRLEAYSDALFSIIATVMIVPVSHTELPEEENLGTSFTRLMLPQIGVYMFTFLVICFFWTIHARLYASLDNVDEFMVLLNLALMMVVTFIPFTFTLLGMFPLKPLAITLFYCAIILISLIMLVFIIHMVRTPSTLKPELREEEARTAYRNIMLSNIAIPLVFAIIGLVFAYISPLVSLVLGVLSIFAPYLRVRLAKCYAKYRSSDSPEVPAYMLQLRAVENVTKDRVEFFSDGVFAIVATLIILDICESDIPDVEMVKKYGSLSGALGHFAPNYLAYAGTFCTVAMQWYVHHTLLHCLLCIGLTPLAFQLTTAFDIHEYKNNETFALQLNCIVIFMASMLQAAIWVVGLYNQDHYLYMSGHHQGDDHGYVTAKLCVYPLLTLLVFWLTVFIESVSVTAFVCMQLGAIGLFILLGLLFAQIRRMFTGRSQRLLLDIDDQVQDLEPHEIH